MLLCAFWMKAVLSQYPLIQDYQMFLIAVSLCTRTLVNHVGTAALTLLSILLMFASISMGLLWCTWLWRFSGNANFFYF